MTWYLSDFGRWKAEREGLERLGIDTQWFVPLGWRIDDRARLVLDADILAGNRTWPVLLQFPEFFPHTPPSVFPRGDTSRWSSHQFGPGGELCLDYGPDNWAPDLTGVHVIDSAHRLLEGENPVTGGAGQLPSRHFDTLGQQFRAEYGRVLLTRNAEQALANIPVRTLLAGTMVSAHHEEVIVHVLREISRQDGTVWTDSGVPAQLTAEFFDQSLHIFRVEPETELPPKSSLADFRTACAATFGFNPDKRYALMR